jgi:hypothetical protein
LSDSRLSIGNLLVRRQSTNPGCGIEWSRAPGLLLVGRDGSRGNSPRLADGRKAP